MAFSYNPKVYVRTSSQVCPRRDGATPDFSPMYGILMKSFALLILLVLLVAPEADAQLRGYPFAPRLYSWRFGVEGGVGVLGSDLTKESQDYHFRPLGNLEFTYVFHRNAAFGAFAGGGLLRSTQASLESNTDFVHGGLLLELRIPTLRGTVFPVFQLRGGVLSMRPDLREGPVTVGEPASAHWLYAAAAGVETISWRRLGIRLLFGVAYTSTDKWDLIIRGDDNDGYSWTALSMQYYFQMRR